MKKYLKRIGFIMLILLLIEGLVINTNIKENIFIQEVDAAALQTNRAHFLGSEGNFSEATKVEKSSDDTVKVPEFSPVKKGYVFQGWKSSRSGKIYQPGQICKETGNIVFTAIYKEEASTAKQKIDVQSEISSQYDANGGDETPKRISILYDANGGDETPKANSAIAYYVLVTKDKPSRTGHRFLGWTNNKDSVIYQGGDKVFESMTLYALWEKEPAKVTYKISYHPNGGSGGPSSETKEKGNAYTISTICPTRAGYKFLGWSRSNSATSATYQPGDLFTVDSSLILYAVWEANEYTLTINPEKTKVTGNSGSIKSISVKEKLTYTVNYDYQCEEEEVEGFIRQSSVAANFKDWGTPTAGELFNENNNEAEYKFESSDASLTATYEDVPNIKLPTPTRPGYVFEGWSKTANRGGVLYKGGTGFTPTDSSIRFYAIWKKATYTLTVNPGEEVYGGNYNDAISIKAPVEWNTVTYNYNGGEGDRTEDKAYREFKSWDEPKIGNIGDKGASVTTYKFGSGNDTIKANYSDEGRLSLPGNAAVKRDGYTFLGWSKDQNAISAEYRAGAAFTTNKDTTLYAVWHKYDVGETTHEISYDANGGSGEPAPQMKEKGIDIYLSSVEPTRAGYKFLGWSRRSSATSAAYKSGDLFTDDDVKILYAIWKANDYILSINHGEEILGNYNEKVNIRAPYEPNYKITYNYNDAANSKIVYAIREFSRWSAPEIGKISDLGASETVYTFGLGNETITATYNTNSIVLESASRNGYTFLGWSKNQNATTAEYYSGQTYAPTGDTTLYAVWKKNETSNGTSETKTYTIQYDANGGVNAPAYQTKTKGKTLILTTDEPTRTGYIFLGWGQESTSTEVKYLPGAKFNEDRNKTLYAVWVKEELETYTITFDANGGTGAPRSQTATQGVETLLTSQQPVRSGYVFLGWDENKNASNPTYYRGDSFIIVYKDTTLYAVWDNAPTFTVSYDANGGSIVQGTQTKIQGVALILSNTRPVRDGFTFLGWSEKSNAVNAEYSLGGIFTKDADTTLYAVWRENTVDNVEAYLIRYFADGGVGIPSNQTKKAGEAVTIGNAPTRAGYEFSEWYINGSSETYRPGDQYTKDESVDLYAAWRKLYTVTYNSNGGSTAPGSQEKVYGRTLTLRSDKLTREGYIFKGWSTSPDTASAMYQPGGNFTENADTTLYAVWVECTSHTGATVANDGRCESCGKQYVTGIKLSYDHLTTYKTDSDGYCVMYLGKNLRGGTVPRAPQISNNEGVSIELGRASYSSSNSSVVDVSSIGEITVKSGGVATITATCGKYSASYTVFAANIRVDTSNNCAVRSSASSDSEYLGYLDDGSYVVLSSTSSGWQYIEAYHNGAENKTGSSLVGGYVYVNSSYTKYSF